MTKLSAILLLLLGACSDGAPAISQEQADPVPDYVEIVEGDGYRGALFTSGSVVVPGFEDRGPIDVAPYGLAFRRASGTEVATFEASFPQRWESLMAGGMDNPPWQPGTSDRLPDFRRQYVGYTDSTGAAGLWINFFPAELASGPGADSGQYADWVLSPIQIDDGGPSFFQVWYSVDRDSTETVIFNGEA